MNNWLEEKYKEGLQISKRFETYKKAIELNDEREGKIIVETGTIRLANDWGAGMSTLIFGDYARRINGHLFTVDNDGAAIEVCKKETAEFKDVISYVVNDSVAFLMAFNQQIDLLYLDSMDCPEYDAPDSPQLLASQTHQLNEFEAARDKLSDRAVVLLDDNDFENGGKTKLTKVELLKHGFTEVMGGKQSLWIRS